MLNSKISTHNKNEWCLTKFFLCPGKICKCRKKLRPFTVYETCQGNVLFLPDFWGKGDKEGTFHFHLINTETNLSMKHFNKCGKVGKWRIYFIWPTWHDYQTYKKCIINTHWMSMTEGQYFLKSIKGQCCTCMSSIIVLFIVLLLVFICVHKSYTTYIIIFT